ncbi:MAG: helix-turn-helix domain-containing protein [Planctomycetes bacterium]|nr:helix-turn-helix domain-containing protein [Gammaproteobacteria bacterium]MCH9775896.1 helix-turn-helix domain-containing protein [Planctomycetota bacterium]
MPELLTSEELAKALKVSPHTVKLWSRNGKIPTVWLSSNLRRFLLADVVERIEFNQTNGGGQCRK